VSLWQDEKNPWFYLPFRNPGIVAHTFFGLFPGHNKVNELRNLFLHLWFLSSCFTQTPFSPVLTHGFLVTDNQSSCDKESGSDVLLFFNLKKILRLVPLVQISFDLVRQGDKPFWQEDDDEDQEKPDNNKPQVGKSE
jgi:hypothetical protein